MISRLLRLFTLAKLGHIPMERSNMHYMHYFWLASSARVHGILNKTVLNDGETHK